MHTGDKVARNRIILVVLHPKKLTKTHNTPIHNRTPQTSQHEDTIPYTSYTPNKIPKHHHDFKFRVNNLRIEGQVAIAIAKEDGCVVETSHHVEDVCDAELLETLEVLSVASRAKVTVSANDQRVSEEKRQNTQNIYIVQIFGQNHIRRCFIVFCRAFEVARKQLFGEKKRRENESKIRELTNVSDIFF